MWQEVINKRKKRLFQTRGKGKVRLYHAGYLTRADMKISD